MASNGVEEAYAVPTVLQAMLTMRSGDNDKKKQAADYLAKFQKSVSRTWRVQVRTAGHLADMCVCLVQNGAWTATISILQTSTEAEAQLFAATTLKGKVHSIKTNPTHVYYQTDDGD